MNWEQLSSPKFAEAVKETGVCLVAMGVVEKHSDHLPLGTDFLNGHALATKAALREPAVVFPPFYFGQIFEARCFPGTVTLPPTLLMELVQSVLKEIRRNGFRKVILVNAHGGNNHLLDFLAQCTLSAESDLAVYVHKPDRSEEFRRAWEDIVDTPVHGHACECETSITLANFPELVDMKAVPAEPALPLGRADHLGQGFTGASWYADYPEHYAGDARTATAEKGRQLQELQVADLARFIAVVKADTTIPQLQAEFFGRVRQTTGGSEDAED